MNQKQSQNEDDIELVFLPSQRIEEGLQKAGAEEEAQKFSAKLDDITRWFKKYRVDSIEFYIEGGAKTGKITELFVSAEGKGGCKVVLKPAGNTPN
jgi:hypothetical protein